MRALLAVVALAGVALAGCSSEAQGDSALGFADALERGTLAALEWDEGAVLIDAYAMERDGATPIPAWLQQDPVTPSQVKEATDNDVGDGETDWWMLAFQARMTSRKVMFAVSTDTILGPLEFLGDVDDDNGSPRPEAPIGDVKDSGEVAATLGQREDWKLTAGFVTWELFRSDPESPPVWLVEQEKDSNVTAAVDASTGVVLCIAGDAGVSFQFSRGVKQGMVNAVQADDDGFTLDAGYKGLQLELSASDEALNRVQATVTAPDGKATTLEWSAGAPTVVVVDDPPGGDWTTHVTLPSGAAASYVLRYSTTTALVHCDA